MRQIITVADIKSLVGKFVIQLNAKDENVDIIHQGNDGFWMEKRIAFVGIIDIIGEDKLKNRFQKQKNPTVILNGLYYCQGTYTAEEFVSIWNDGYKDSKDRFYRLLTTKELDWLNKLQKERNY
jgi:hypothetical protein